MALQASGAISLNDIQTEFGGSNPIGINEYYRDGSYVGSNNTSVPTSGAIDFADFYSTTAALVLNITSNATEQNIKTLAVAAGLTDGSGVPIIVNISAILTGSSTHALQTGDLDNSHDITININSGGEINGFTGATGANGTGAAGSTGGDAIYWGTDAGGSPTYIVNLSGGKLRSGGGGGGGGGQRGVRNTRYFEKYGDYCGTPSHYGSFGSDGAAGGYGQAGSSGGSGTWGGGSTDCNIQSPGGGGAGGAAGYALRKNSRTVTFNNTSGTLAGSVG